MSRINRMLSLVAAQQGVSEVAVKHLQGKHDQSTHGNWAGSRSEFKPNNLSGGQPRVLPNGGSDWADVVGAGGQDNHNLVMAGAIALERLDISRQGQVFTTKDEVSNYMESVFAKYGFGNRAYSLTPDHPMLPNDAEAAVSRGMTEDMPDDSPYKNTVIPVLLYRSKGISQFTLLHEIAHIMEGDWADASRTNSGHSDTWFNTWRFLLRNEGLSFAAKMLDFFTYPQENNGVFDA